MKKREFTSPDDSRSPFPMRPHEEHSQVLSIPSLRLGGKHYLNHGKWGKPKETIRKGQIYGGKKMKKREVPARRLDIGVDGKEARKKWGERIFVVKKGIFKSSQTSFSK